MKLLDLDGSALRRAGARQAQAEIEFARAPAGGTYIARQRVGYPFHLGRALHSPADPAGMPTIYLQSCSGGLFEGDDLALSLRAGAQSQAHVTTGAATIVHGMERDPAIHRVDLDVGAGAFLEYLPDPTILFSRACLDTSVHLRLHPGATAIIGDSLLLHDPAGGGTPFGWLRSETRVESTEGRLLACDRFLVSGETFSRRLPGITGASTAQGSLFILGAGNASALVDLLRGALDQPGCYGGAGLLPNQAGAWARMLAVDAVALRTAMFAAWSAARTVLTGAAPQHRRK